MHKRERKAFFPKKMSTDWQLPLLSWRGGYCYAKKHKKITVNSPRLTGSVSADLKLSCQLDLKINFTQLNQSKHYRQVWCDQNSLVIKIQKQGSLLLQIKATIMQTGNTVLEIIILSDLRATYCRWLSISSLWILKLSFWRFFFKELGIWTFGVEIRDDRLQSKDPPFNSMVTFFVPLGLLHYFFLWKFSLFCVLLK